jgi:hypothetical protein
MNATPNIAGQLFAVPPDQADAGGLHIGGGWHPYSDHVDHGRVLLLPPVGDYSVLSGLGYRALGHQSPSDAQAPLDGMDMGLHV